MSHIPENFLDRIECSAIIFKKGFKQIILPIFCFSFITQVVIFTIMGSIFMSFIDISSLSSNPDEGMLDLWTNSDFIIWLVVGIFLFLLYSLLWIPFMLATIKAVQHAMQEKQNIVSQNISYGFKNTFSIFQVYWNIFAYVALIPSLIFIVGGLILITGQLQDIAYLERLGYLISMVAVFTFLTLSLYRGIRSTFGIYSSIHDQDFSKENFMNSVLITNDKWWRIVGNLFGFGLLISLAIGVVSGFIATIFGILTPNSLLDIIVETLEAGVVDQEKITAQLEAVPAFSILQIIQESIGVLLQSLQTTFAIVFTYIFYLRLVEENQEIQKIDPSTGADDTIEL